MKISVLSDLHFGFASNSELEMDSYDNAEEAVGKSLGSDLMVICGDIFDVRLPKTQSWANALRILSRPLLAENTGIRLVSSTKKLKGITEKRTLDHLPVVALHGNHERRARDELNTLQALENAGLLIYLNLDTVVFEKDGTNVAIHGMSSVPETYAKDVLEKWGPKPVEGCFNILLLHQSIEPFVFSPLEPPTISLSSLPKGFDLIIDGHLHGHTEERLGRTRFLIPGSTVVTQLEKNEADTDKGIYELSLGKEMHVRFVPLEKARKFFYEDVQTDSCKTGASEEIERRIAKMVGESSSSKKPIVKIRLLGKETGASDRELADIRKRFDGKAILMFSKKLAKEDSKLEILKDVMEQKMPIEDVGMSMLGRNLDGLGFSKSFDAERMFHLLADGGIDNAISILLGEQATLER